MSNWVFPLVTARDVSLGASDSALAVDGWAHTGLKVASLAPGAGRRRRASRSRRGADRGPAHRLLHRNSGRHRLQAGRVQQRLHRPLRRVVLRRINKAVTFTSADGARVAVATAQTCSACTTRPVTANQHCSSEAPRNHHSPIDSIAHAAWVHPTGPLSAPARPGTGRRCSWPSAWGKAGCGGPRGGSLDKGLLRPYPGRE